VGKGVTKAGVVEAHLQAPDQDHPLVSICVYNYDGQNLAHCLDSIFQQDLLTSFEVILIDDATSDGSWEQALAYPSRYPSLLTLHRNKKVLGPVQNRRYCRRIAKGKYFATLTDQEAFSPEVVLAAIRAMIADPNTRFKQVGHIKKPYILPPSILKTPLVSILCYNYNYGRYLEQSLESAFAQTYPNIEVCFSDNASTDDSWNIAQSFARRYPGRMTLTRNRKNLGPDTNFGNCYKIMEGKYYINFCSDDVLAPDYVERCVDALEANPNAGMAIVNRAIIDEHGKRTDEPPFYNQSCLIPGEEQAAVYMMAGINPSVSQIMYRRALVDGRSATGTLAARYYGTRILDFNIALDYDVVYLDKPLLMHRLHSESDTSQADTNLLPVLGVYVLNHQFADAAAVRNQRKVSDRLPQSLEKLAHLATRYAVRSLLGRDEGTGQRYFHLAAAIHPPSTEDPTWKRLQEYWTADGPEKGNILQELGGSNNLASRRFSYDPPPGSIALLEDGRKCAEHPVEAGVRRGSAPQPSRSMNPIQAQYVEGS